MRPALIAAIAVGGVLTLALLIMMILLFAGVFDDDNGRE